MAVYCVLLFITDLINEEYDILYRLCVSDSELILICAYLKPVTVTTFLSERGVVMRKTS